MNADSFQLDTIHEKNRMAIMSLLAASKEMSFTDIRESLKMTDGNLVTHIRTLQKAGTLQLEIGQGEASSDYMPSYRRGSDAFRVMSTCWRA